MIFAFFGNLKLHFKLPDNKKKLSFALGKTFLQYSNTSGIHICLDVMFTAVSIGVVMGATRKSGPKKYCIRNIVTQQKTIYIMVFIGFQEVMCIYMYVFF